MHMENVFHCSFSFIYNYLLLIELCGANYQLAGFMHSFSLISFFFHINEKCFIQHEILKSDSLQTFVR